MRDLNVSSIRGSIVCRLLVNRGADANRLDDLLTFMSNAILKSGRIYLGCRNLQNSMYQGGMIKQRS